MQLRELNLPLENNLFVINTNSKDTGSGSSSGNNASALYGESNTKIDSFELNIQVVKNRPTNGHQVTIVNNSKSVEAISLAAHLETRSFPKLEISSSSNYHLHFEPNIKFIEIKRKINLLTSIATNEQEWWLYLNKNNNKDTLDSKTTEASLEVLMENGSLFNMPLTFLIENDMKLIDLKILLDNLTETNTKVVTSSSSQESGASSGLTPLVNNFSSNGAQQKSSSKLTPPHQQNVLNISFLVTQKKLGMH